MTCRIAVALLATTLLALSCAPTRIITPPVTVEGRVDAATDGSEVDLSLGSAELFARGHAAYDAGHSDRALVLFLAVVHNFSDAPEYSDSAYNAASILFKQKRWAEAADLFSAVVAARQSSKDVLDARFRLLACYEQMGDWRATSALIDEIYDSGTRLSPDDRVELQARAGAVLAELGELEKAEETLSNAFHEYQIGLRRGDIVNEYAGAMAAYYLGMIERARFDNVKLVIGTIDQMGDVFEEKAQHLQLAQDYFLRAIEQDNAYWATAAGLQIGRLYRDFYDAMRAVKYPEGVEEGSEDAAMYDCMLIEKVDVLLRKAMRVYDNTVEIGERLRVRNRFTDQTQNELADVKARYLADAKRCEKILPDEDLGSILDEEKDKQAEREK